MYFGYRNRISTRRVFLLTGDIIVVTASIVLSAMIRLGLDGSAEYIYHNIISLTGSCLIFLAVFYAGGMYDRHVVTRKSESFRLTLIVTVVSLAIIILIFYARFEWHIGRGILLLSGLFIFMGSWFLRRVFRFALGYGVFSKNCLLLAEQPEAERVLQLLKESPDAGYTLFGVVTADASMDPQRKFIQGIPVLGPVENLRDYVTAYDVESIIVATSRVHEPVILQILRPLRYSGVEIMDYIGLSEELAQQIPLDYIDDEWLMNAAMNSSRIHIRQIKRILDFTVAVTGIALLSPIWLASMVLIKLTSKGPVLYRQVRTGLDGIAYTLLKFRTMRTDAEAQSGPVWALARDTRITRVGLFLRKWRIDEIPQLVNVLRGEMSLVGPRPERPEFIETLEAAIPFYKERLLVPPGITGWAQVCYPYTSTIEGVRNKLQYDLFYIKNMSFFLDVIILLRTFKTIVVGLRYSDELREQDEHEKAEQEILSAHRKGDDSVADSA
jgi:exopolysaccharide biosynthesis polyprenyl glycosylphosphotransferase